MIALALLVIKIFRRVGVFTVSVKTPTLLYFIVSRQVVQKNKPFIHTLYEGKHNMKKLRTII